MKIEERLNILIAAHNAALEKLGGCGDGGCIVHRPRGQHTNGGCRCNHDAILMGRLAHVNSYFAAEVANIVRGET